MRSPERNNTPPPTAEIEHLDDFEAADLALRGIQRVTEDRLRQEALKKAEEEELAKKRAALDDDDYEYWYGDHDDDYNDYDDYEDDDRGWGEIREDELEREQKFELFTIPPKIIAEYKLPEDLPDGVAIMGGTARSLARRIVTGDKEPVRDLDLVFIPELADADNPPTYEELNHLSAKYMPDDYSYGHGISTEHLENYFKERDLTVNQCLIAGNKLLMTRAAYDDFQENIIRPSFYEQRKTDEPISDRIFLKALLLQATFSDFTDSYPTLEDFDVEEIDREIEENKHHYIRISPFNIALTMNKAMGRDARIAMKFTENLVDWDLVDEEYLGHPMLLARDARNLCYNFNFYPNDNPIEGMRDDPLDYRSLEEEFKGLEHYQSTDPAVRAAMREYDSTSPKQDDDFYPERFSGAYTRDDYDWINHTRQYQDKNSED